MDNETERVAQIIAEAADKFLGLRPDGIPKQHDMSAAEAITAEFVLIHRDEMPAVRDSGQGSDTYLTDGESVCFTSEANARMWVMRDVAVWQHIARKEKAHKAKRRDELAIEYFEDVYDHLPRPACRAAIDRIIELEDAA